MGQLSENGKSDAFIEPLQTMVRSARRGQRETFISDASLAGTGHLPGAYLQAQRMTLRTLYQVQDRETAMRKQDLPNRVHRGIPPMRPRPATPVRASGAERAHNHRASNSSMHLKCNNLHLRLVQPAIQFVPESHPHPLADRTDRTDHLPATSFRNCTWVAPSGPQPHVDNN